MLYTYATFILYNTGLTDDRMYNDEQKEFFQNIILLKVNKYFRFLC